MRTDALEIFMHPAMVFGPTGLIKKKAAEYLGMNINSRLSKRDQRKLEAKTQKLKKSSIKADRRLGSQLTRQITFIE